MSRPQFNPTPEQRGMVKSMAAMGILHEHIALKIGVRSPKTLRKHFRQELDLGAVEADYKVMSTLFQMATSGEHPGATIFWAKTRIGLREQPAFERAAGPPPPFVVECRQEGGQL
jgi:hypothetical protein